MSALGTFLRRFNFTQMNTPDVMRLGQQVSREIALPELAAVGRWSLAGGILVYWMIEPNFEQSK